MNRSDEMWHEDRMRYGWVLPRPAAWPLRLPVVRWFRAMYHDAKSAQWAAGWNSVGIGFGGPPQYDRWVVYAMYRGWC